MLLIKHEYLLEKYMTLLRSVSAFEWGVACLQRTKTFELCVGTSQRIIEHTLVCKSVQLGILGNIRLENKEKPLYHKKFKMNYKVTKLLWQPWSISYIQSTSSQLYWYTFFSMSFDIWNPYIHWFPKLNFSYMIILTLWGMQEKEFLLDCKS